MINASHDYLRVSDAESRAKKIYSRLIDGDELTPGQVVDICREIKRLPFRESAGLWQRLRDAMSQENFDGLHNFYVQWTLGKRWG
jgi:hypothetical protein